MTQTVTTSDGEVFSVPTMSPGDEWHMRRLQRRMSRRQAPRRGEKGQAPQSPSKGWFKAKAALQRFHGQQARRRLDAIHKLTTMLTSGEHYDAIVMEDLTLRG